MTVCPSRAVPFDQVSEIFSWKGNLMVPSAVRVSDWQPFSQTFYSTLYNNLLLIC